jgi:hypothetical protein
MFQFNRNRRSNTTTATTLTSTVDSTSSSSSSSAAAADQLHHGHHSHHRHGQSSSSSTIGTPPASKAYLKSMFHVRIRCDDMEVLREVCPNENCVICCETESFQNNDVVTTLPCGHMFHSSCIMDWLKRKCTCPTCRYELPTDNPQYEKQKRRRKQQMRQVQQSEEDNARNNSIIFFDGREELLSSKLRHPVFRQHENFDLIMKRTLRMKKELEQQRKEHMYEYLQEKEELRRRYHQLIVRKQQQHHHQQERFAEREQQEQQQEETTQQESEAHGHDHVHGKDGGYVQFLELYAGVPPPKE